MNEPRTVNVGDPQVVRDIATDQDAQIVEVDGWLHVTVGGTVYKAETLAAVA